MKEVLKKILAGFLILLGVVLLVLVLFFVCDKLAYITNYYPYIAIVFWVVVLVIGLSYCLGDIYYKKVKKF